MDVVHVSEWRGSGYLCLVAKRQKLAFDETLFIVKTSSPWMWNRLYGSQPLDRLDDLAKVHAERRSVELADMVIGGSLHLLRWMTSQGYHIPRSRTFVQPNVIKFDHIQPLIAKRGEPEGRRRPVDEVVFFGRLEARKGLLTFCQAIKRIVRQGKPLPRQITFMGKAGARLTARPDQDIIDYIRTESADWPTKIEILTELQQYDALNYLLSGDRLAVMPSTIENSSLAVYEAAICRIPFVASASGGTPELVAEEDQQHVLCDAHPIPLADKISEALELGGYVARPRFDNAVILQQWRQFHLDLGRGLASRFRDPGPRHPSAAPHVSVCIYHADSDEKLRMTLASLKQQDQLAHQVLVAVDTDDKDSESRVAAVLADAGVEGTVLPAFDLDAGLGFNALAARASGDFLLFLWSGSTLKSPGLRMLSKVAESSGADVINYFYRVTNPADSSGRDYLSATILGSVAQSFYRLEQAALPLFVRRTAFTSLGGFTSDYRSLAQDYEFVARAQIGGLHCETALVELGSVPAWDEAWLRARCYDRSFSQFRAIRPHLAAAPLALRELLLMAKGLQARPAARRAAPGPKKVAVQNVSNDKDGAIGRLLTALSSDLMSGKPPEPAPPRPQKPAPKPAPPKAVSGGARMTGLAQLIDELSGPDSIDQPSTAEAPSPLKPMVQKAPVQRPRPSDIRATPDLPYTLVDDKGLKYRGRVLAVHDGSAFGWVRSLDQPAKPVTIDVVSDGKVLWTGEAGGSAPCVPPSTQEMRQYGFVAPLQFGWKGLSLLKGPRPVEVRIKNVAAPIARLNVGGGLLWSLERAGYDGYCDIIDNMIRGWVWNPTEPSTSVDVAVFVGGRFLARSTANAPRDDLRVAGVGTGAYGFAVPLPKSVRDGATYSVEVVVADAGVLLKRGRLRLTGDVLAVAS
jgi:glycosyltransferase involved in cell wall biosynthesis